jgi:hypothetical protein
MQQSRQANNTIGVVQLLGRDFVLICASLCDYVVVLIAIARWPKTLL